MNPERSKQRPRRATAQSVRPINAKGAVDEPLEYVRAIYRPEHYTFSMRLNR
jgi:DNA-binding GntR family transcriptional regulator